jgi:hypothetical protein
VAEHADEWHTFGDPGTLARKSRVLDDWCEQAGRDPKEIVRSTTIFSQSRGEQRDGDSVLELGFTDFVVSVQGPDWDLKELERALAWRDGVS